MKVMGDDAGDRAVGRGPDTHETVAVAVRRLSAVPLDLAEANAFVTLHHRHHKPVIGHKFSIGCAAGDVIVGAAIIGRPVARHRDDGLTLEVTRLCTDGTRNACSFLYGAAARAAFALGYRRIGTYILASEPGTSLTGAGWKLIGETSGGSWTRSSRPRVDKHPLQRKLLFEAVTKGAA
jgi:hypothetical protein